MYKQVIVVRKDLKMNKGKIAAQVAHASIGAYKKSDGNVRKKWEAAGSKKVILKIETLDEMLKVKALAEKNDVSCFLVKDAGRTQVKPGTVTVLGLGPEKDEILDKITGNLKML